ncbi:MAG: rRNA maturation RNase YbeY [Candidatus Moranbacteria bacterium]|nr:rRNA maturation RNase YbeY [Candidatus Moranbacteria bacterium]
MKIKQKNTIKIKIFFEVENGFLSKFKKKLDANLLKKALIKCLKNPKCPQQINIVFIDNNKIKKLNSKYRKINKATDVLSFNYEKQEDPLKNIIEQNTPSVGEIYLSVEYIKQKSNKTKRKLGSAIISALIHGLLHLSGFNHYNKKDSLKMKKMHNCIKKYMERATSSAG